MDFAFTPGTGRCPWVWRRCESSASSASASRADHGRLDTDFLTVGLAMEEIGRGDLFCAYWTQLAGLAGRDHRAQRRWLSGHRRDIRSASGGMVA